MGDEERGIYRVSREYAGGGALHVVGEFAGSTSTPSVILTARSRTSEMDVPLSVRASLAFASAPVDVRRCSGGCPLAMTPDGPGG